MIALQMSQLEKSFGGETLFSKMTLEVKTGETVGIVGKNGAGKTTLMKIMAGIEDYDYGFFNVPKTINVGYLTQQMSLESDDTVYNEMKKPFQSLIELESNMQQAAMWLSEHSHTHPEYEDKLKLYERYQNEFESKDGYHIDAKIQTVITGLNFEKDDLHKSVSTFSGGQKTRLQLAQMLLNAPELLLLDEPTNHLDMDTVKWLESYLKSFNGAIVIISHDRYFLDAISTKIYEVELGKGTLYHGNYSKYIKEKEKQYALDLKAYERQQKEIKNLETFIDKNIARASTSGMAKSRRKMLEQMDIMDSPTNDRRKTNFSFSIDRESGNDVLRVKDLSIGYSDVLKSNINFAIDRNERVAILGPNGIGKSTLIQTIGKKLSKLSGDIQYGTNVSIGYYDQKQAEFMSQNTVLEELWKAYPHMNETDVRKVLGQFLFTQDDVKKHINDLSGGEKARIQLSKLMLERQNFLLLDEPTNHLDISSKEVLEDALLNYQGTLLFISHDRYFINKLATKVIELSEDDTFIVNGDYEYFLHKKEEKETLQEDTIQETQAPEKETDYVDQKKKRNELKRLEKEMKQLENDMKLLEDHNHELNQQLTEPEIFNDYVKANELNEKINENNALIESYIERLIEIEEQLNNFA